jgi:hypothetical protein
MNANELADEWDKNLKPHERHGNHAETMYWIEQYRLYGSKAATMLRKQQAEIDQLRSLIAPKEIPANVRIMYQIFDGKEWLNMGEINER